MADNVTIPATGSGTATPIVATDDVSGIHYQRVKLDGGGDGASTPILAGAQASASALAVVGPNDEFVTVTTAFNRPADTTAYAVNDTVSDSTSAPTTFTISNAAKASGGSGLITDIVVVSNNDPATPLQGEIFIFDSSVTSPNDNAAFALSDADMAKLVGVVPIALEDVGNNDVDHIQGLNMGFTCVGSANLRFLVRAKNAYTPASGEAFTFRFKIQRLT
ncbi:hypothetical protein [Taklimakanibacter deserti]|uniref:hypothetical protein n=1 Tax=Taklimakanibacter deserti TaxID=2267839 RepID=UPI000E655BF5